jgi:hypothetical protein
MRGSRHHEGACSLTGPVPIHQAARSRSLAVWLLAGSAHLCPSLHPARYLDMASDRRKMTKYHRSFFCFSCGTDGTKDGVLRCPEHHVTSLQAVYPATTCRALSAHVRMNDREAHAALMRQAKALLRWAHKFDAAEHLQHAERYLRERVEVMIKVRSPHASYLSMHWYCMNSTSEAAIWCAAGGAPLPGERGLRHRL